MNAPIKFRSGYNKLKQNEFNQAYTAGNLRTAFEILTELPEASDSLGKISRAGFLEQAYQAIFEALLNEGDAKVNEIGSLEKRINVLPESKKPSINT